MPQQFWVACIFTSCLFTPLAMAYADNVDQVHPMHIVKDSAVTSLVKSKLAAEHTRSMKDVKVETDDRGVVWLSGEADSQSSISEAERIARNTVGVVEVRNQIIVKSK